MDMALVTFMTYWSVERTPQGLWVSLVYACSFGTNRLWFKSRQAHHNLCMPPWLSHKCLNFLDPNSLCHGINTSPWLDSYAPYLLQPSNHQSDPSSYFFEAFTNFITECSFNSFGRWHNNVFFQGLVMFQRSPSAAYSKTSSIGTNRAAVVISTGYYYSFKILNDGFVSCLGSNIYGHLGDRITDDKNTP